MVIWPALQARAFALVIFNCAMVRRRRRLLSSFVIWLGIGALLAGYFLVLGMHFSSGPWLSLLYLDPTRMGDPGRRAGCKGTLSECLFYFGIHPNCIEYFGAADMCVLQVYTEIK